MRQTDRFIRVATKTWTLLRGSTHPRPALTSSLLVLCLVCVGPVAMLAKRSTGTLWAQADAVPSPCDFATSGGFVFADSGRKANFGAHGGCKNGEFWGHVNFVDHTTGYHVNSVEVTGYSTPYPGSNIRDICGTAETNAAEAQPVRFRVRVVDNNGTADQFGIRLSNGYNVTTRPLGAGGPGGGKVQLHDFNPSTTAPNPEPGIDAMCQGVASPSSVVEE